MIEWGELLSSDLLDDYLEVFIERDIDGRKVRFDAHGTRSQELLEDLQNG